jgi:ketosteroid isomerase-like protein
MRSRQSERGKHEIPDCFAAARLHARARNAGPTEDAFVVIEQFKKAYDASDPPAIVKLFAPDAIFLGTTMQRPTRDKARLRVFAAVPPAWCL